MKKNIQSYDRRKNVVFLDFIQCLDGALVSSEVNTLNSSGSDPRKSVDTGTTVDIHQRKHRG